MRLNYAYRDEELAFLCATTATPSTAGKPARPWPPASCCACTRGEGEATLSACLIDAFAQLLDHADSDPAFAALA